MWSLMKIVKNSDDSSLNQEIALGSDHDINEIDDRDTYVLVLFYYKVDYFIRVS